jgi:hypothetical protein
LTLVNSNDPTLSDCIACQVELYSKTDILVGVHGAGASSP